MTKYPLKKEEFIGFITKYVKKKRSTEKPNVTTSLNIHQDIKDEMEEEDEGKLEFVLEMNTDLLEIALNNIVENANKHAFVDSSKQYKLEFRISLYQNSSFIKVEVANDGKPFPKKYSIVDFKRKNSFAGETGNTGQGGYILNEIIKHHNKGKSTLDIVFDDFSNEFTTTYIFLIPVLG